MMTICKSEAPAIPAIESEEGGMRRASIQRQQSPLRFDSQARQRADWDGLESADRDLEQRIERFLRGRNIPGLRGIRVTVHGGISTLTGSVNSFHHKQLATSCCQRVAGVIRVINEVEVPRG